MYGIEYGNNRFKTTNNSESITQEQLASRMGISVDTLQNYKMLADMIPELSDLVDTGIVTTAAPSILLSKYTYNILTIYIICNNI